MRGAVSTTPRMVSPEAAWGGSRRIFASQSPENIAHHKFGFRRRQGETEGLSHVGDGGNAKVPLIRLFVYCSNDFSFVICRRVHKNGVPRSRYLKSNYNTLSRRFRRPRSPASGAAVAPDLEAPRSGAPSAVAGVVRASTRLLADLAPADQAPGHHRCFPITYLGRQPRGRGNSSPRRFG